MFNVRKLCCRHSNQMSSSLRGVWVDCRPLRQARQPHFEGLILFFLFFDFFLNVGEVALL